MTKICTSDSPEKIPQTRARADPGYGRTRWSLEIRRRLLNESEKTKKKKKKRARLTNSMSTSHALEDEK